MQAEKQQMAEKTKVVRRSNRALKPRDPYELPERLLSNTHKSLILSASTGEIVNCRANSTKTPRNVDAKPAVNQGGCYVDSVQTSSISTAKNKDCRATSTKKFSKVDATLTVKQGGDNLSTVDTSSTSTAKMDDCLAVKPRDPDILPMNRVMADSHMSNVSKTQYRYEIDVSEMAERSTINMADFKHYLRNSFMKYAIKHKLANRVTVEDKDFNVVVTSEIFFKKSALKYHAKKFLKKEKLRHYVKVVKGSNQYSYRFMYYEAQK